MRFRRKAHLLAPGLWLFALILLMHPLRAGAQPPRQVPSVPTLVDGEWMAFVSSGGPISGEGYSGSVTYTGGSDFISGDGVVTGTWDLVGSSAFSGECFDATAEITILGNLTGTSQVPVLRQTDIGGTGVSHNTCTGQSQTGPVPISGPGLVAEVTLTSATCEVVMGTFSIPENLTMASVGASSDLVADFVATRIDAVRGDPDHYANEVTDLLLDAGNFERAVEAGDSSVGSADLHNLIERAENLSRGLRHSEECGYTSDGAFLIVLDNILRELIDFVLGHPDVFSAADLNYLISASIRAGILGSGALNPADAAELEQRFKNDLRNRIDEGGDCLEMTLIAQAAYNLGAADLGAQALAASAAACGGG